MKLVKQSRLTAPPPPPFPPTAHYFGPGSGTTGHVEFYESEKDEWTEADSLRVGRSAASACTVRGLNNIQEFTFYGKEAKLVAHSASIDWQVCFSRADSTKYLHGFGSRGIWCLSRAGAGTCTRAE